jgi:1,4-alpha-glucan branching enzyme
LFVTLNKSEKQFSPTTMYHDYAINEHLFHWQSQNSARPDRGKGLSYVEQNKNAKRVFLFVREQSKDENGRTMSFVNFGEVNYVSHTGSQPMSITWRLLQTMPSFMWKQAAKLAVG